MLSKNHSYFFIPFKVKNIDQWKRKILSKEYKYKDEKKVAVWKEENTSVAVHLMKFINDAVGYGTERQSVYKLMDKRAYGLPYTDKRNKLLSCIIKSRGIEKEYVIDICNIRIHCYGTQIGFLVYDVWYSASMNYGDILEFNYSFKHIGRTTLKIQNAEPLSDIVGNTYLYKLSKSLIANGLDDEIELFFNSSNIVNMECNVFSIYCDEEKKQIEDKLFHLCHSYTKDYGYNVGSQDEAFQLYYPYPYIHWGYCQNGISCVYYDACEFTHNGLNGKLQNDYYFMYLLLLHQRYSTLSLMGEITNCKNASSEEWKRIQRNLTIYRMEYSFCVVSDEMAYHRIYKDLREVLSINEFEDCLTDISDRMYMMNSEEQHEKEEKAANLRGWRLDIALGVLSLLTVFSAFVDSTELAKMWCSNEENHFGLLWLQGIFYIFIIYATIMVVQVLKSSYVQYRKKLKKEWIERKKNK